MMTRSFRSLRLSPLVVFAALSLGAKPCKDPCPPYPPQGMAIVWNGDRGDLLIPEGATMSAPNPCVQPADVCSSGPISGRVGVYIERQAGVSYVRIDPTAVDLALGPFDQGGTLVEVGDVELREQDIRIDESTGKLGGRLGLGVATNQGLFSVDLALAGQLDADSGALNVAITDASMSCE